MKFFDLLTISFMNLWRRKMRAFLTVLGMAIGTTAIVLLISLGLGINELNVERLSQWGNLMTIEVYNYRYQEPTESAGGGVVYYNSINEIKLDAKAVSAFKKIPGVTAVMPMVQMSAYLKSGQYGAYANIQAVDINEAEAFGYTLEEGGRLPHAHSGSNYEIVLGSWTLMDFQHTKTYRQAIDQNGNPKLSLEHSRFQLTFDDSNIWDYGSYDDGTGGQTQQKGKLYNITPVGVLSQNNNSSYMCLMDINAIKRLYRENKAFMQNFDESTYSQVSVMCASMDVVQEVQQAINDLGYQTYSMNDALEMEQENSAQLQMLLLVIGGVALFVAAIGIMNTMMMSIYERTREIGIIKVLGCRMNNIAGLFLMEAALIGLFGGALGLAVSYITSYVLNTQLVDSAQIRSVIPLWLSFGGVAFSMVVALVSGMYPAFRAMRVSALSAIRAE